MDVLPFSTAADLVEHIEHCRWQNRAYRNFRLQKVMLQDIAFLAKTGEDDLQSIASFFAESAKERLSAIGGKWSWRTRESIVGYKSPYLNWLKNQWAMGRWAEDSTIHRNARHFLDPRLARFESLSYLSGADNLFGKSWSEIVRGYRDVVGQEARLRSDDESLAASRVSKAGVEGYALNYFEKRGWVCRCTNSNIGNILTVERALPDSEYVFRLALSLADKSLLDHVEGWISVTISGADLRMVSGGPDRLIGSSIDGLLFPASTYYLTHDKEYSRIVHAIALIDSIVQALTQPEADAVI